MFYKSGLTNRKNLNFSEYKFKGNYNSFCNFPNSDFVRTSLNNNIQRNNQHNPNSPHHSCGQQINKTGGRPNG